MNNASYTSNKSTWEVTEQITLQDQFVHLRIEQIIYYNYWFNIGKSLIAMIIQNKKWALTDYITL